MTKAPERIWVEDCSGEWLDDTGAWGADRENDWDVEYVRADLHVLNIDRIQRIIHELITSRMISANEGQSAIAVLYLAHGYEL